MRSHIIGIAVDAGDSNIIPTITIEDADNKTVKPPLNGSGLHHEKVVEEPEQLVGAIPTRLADAVPHWYRVGWRAMSGIDELRAEGIAKDKAILDSFLSEQFYGDWYHNAGIIVFVRDFYVIFGVFLNHLDYKGCLCVSFPRKI